VAISLAKQRKEETDQSTVSGETDATALLNRLQRLFTLCLAANIHNKLHTREPITRTQTQLEEVEQSSVSDTISKSLFATAEGEISDTQ